MTESKDPPPTPTSAKKAIRKPNIQLRAFQHGWHEVFAAAAPLVRSDEGRSNYLPPTCVCLLMHNHTGTQAVQHWQVPLSAQYSQMSTTFHAFIEPKHKNAWENGGIGWFDVALMRALIYRNNPQRGPAWANSPSLHRAVSVRSLHLWVCISSI